MNWLLLRIRAELLQCFRGGCVSHYATFCHSNVASVQMPAVLGVLGAGRCEEAEALCVLPALLKLASRWPGAEDSF